MASPEGGDDDRPPSNPPPHAGDQHTHRPHLDLPPLPPQIHSKARPSSSTVLPENTIVLALSGHTSELPTPSLPPHDTNRPPKTKKKQSKTKPSSRVPFPPTVDAVPPTLPTSGDAQQLLTIPANQPCNEFTMPTLAASGSSNISPRQSQLHIASAQLPVTVQGHSSLEEPTHDDLNQPSYAQNSDFATPLLAAPGSSNSHPRPVQLRSAAEQVPAAITDQPGLREPVHDDLNQPPNCQFPEPTLAAAAETSSRAEFISTLTASIAAAVDALLRPNSSPPTSTSPIQPILPMSDHSPAAAKETNQPALKSQTSQNPNLHPFPPITTRAHNQTQTHDPRNPTHTRAHLKTQTPTLEATQTRTHQTHPTAQIQQPLNQISAHTPKPNYNQTQPFAKTPFNPSKNSYASIINPASILNPDALPHPQKS